MAECRALRVHVHQNVVVWAGGRADADVDVWFHPAFGDSRSSYQHAFESVLSRQARIFVLDPPGHGASPPGPRGFTLAQGVRLWCELIEQFSPSRRVVLVGHSMAGIIASRVAPALRRSPSLVIGVEANLTPADAFFTGLAARFDEPTGFHALLRERIRRIARRDASVNRFAWSLECADPNTLWTLGRSVFAQKDPGASFRKLRGAKVHYWDAIRASDQTRNYIARHAIPERRLDGLGHWPMLKRPETFYAAIAGDVRRVTA